MDSRLTEVLVCPICKGPLTLETKKSELHCAKCAKGFTVVGEIPVMLAVEARDLTEEEVKAARVASVQGK